MPWPVKSASHRMLRMFCIRPELEELELYPSLVNWGQGETSNCETCEPRVLAL